MLSIDLIDVITSNINVVCYADDIALIADTEVDLQRLLYNFHLSCLTISKEPIR